MTSENTDHEKKDHFESTQAIVEKFHEENDPDYVYALVSGGGDSDTACEVAQEFGIDISGVVHVNTGIGIEDTRRYVMDRCLDWGLSFHELTSLSDADSKRRDDGVSHRERFTEIDDGVGKTLEKHPYDDLQTRYYGVRRSNDDYEKLVRKMGFPGPDLHWVMYLALKHKPITNFVTKFHDDDDEIAFISGVRKKESDRRAENMSEDGLSENWGGCTVVSPIADWSDTDVSTYRRERDLPSNPVSDLIGMSGECLCGAYGSREEIEQLLRWGFTDVARQIEQLEWEVFITGVSKGYISPEYGIWGHGNTEQPLNLDADDDMQMMLCADCEEKCDPAVMEETDAVTDGEVAIRNKVHCEVWDRWFYCPDCDVVINDPIEHRREVHSVTPGAPYIDAMPWDVREINLDSLGDDAAYENITEPVLTDQELTKEKRMEDPIKQSLLPHDHSHEFTPTKNDGVEQCNECGVSRLQPDALRDKITASDKGEEATDLITVEPGVLSTIIPLDAIDASDVVSSKDELETIVTTDEIITLLEERVDSMTRYINTDPSFEKFFDDAGLRPLLDEFNAIAEDVLDQSEYTTISSELKEIAADEDVEEISTSLQPEIDPDQVGLDSYTSSATKD